MRAIILLAATALALQGCSTAGKFQPMPAGIGGSPNQLKRTPCAGGCGEVRQKNGLPEFLRDRKASV